MVLQPAALAHVGLAKTVPDHDAVLERAPTQIRLQFGSKVTITNARLDYLDGPRKGQRITLRLPRDNAGFSTASGTDIALELPLLEPATYQVYYQATSVDGQILVDDFLFSIKPERAK